MSRLLSIISLSLCFVIFSFVSSFALNYSDHYVSLSAGVSKLNEIEDAETSGHFSEDTNYVINAAFGANIRPSVRGEVEYSYREHGDLTHTPFPGDPPVPISVINNFTIINSVMMNLYYDFDISGSRFVPFLTGGTGVSRLTSGSIFNYTLEQRRIIDPAIDAAIAATIAAAKLVNIIIDADDLMFETIEDQTGVPPGQAVVNVVRETHHTILAIQLGAGASYEIDDRNSIIFGYKFFAMGHTEFSRSEVEHVNTHEVYVGYKYNF